MNAAFERSTCYGVDACMAVVGIVPAKWVLLGFVAGVFAAIAFDWLVRGRK